LRWAVDRQLAALEGCRPGELASRALSVAMAIADEDVAACEAIGRHGVGLLRDIHHRSGRTVNVLTHCNAGWLAFVDHGTATSPIYAAHDEGIPVHVWVDETRPVNQGARLTAWELGEHGVAHTVVVDNAGGHLMQRGMVDVVITGTDRTATNGDVINKIGTYLKALAAHDNGIPFYVALPSSTLDPGTPHGLSGVPIEERDQREVTHVVGTTGTDVVEVRVTPDATQALNYGFDVTPARLVTGLITERGICDATQEAITALFPDLISADRDLAHETSRTI
jgi:methylthioribose-1-phosphate isomerase